MTEGLEIEQREAGEPERKMAYKSLSKLVVVFSKQVKVKHARK